MIIDRPETFTDDELERELTIAASTRGQLRLKRFENLLAEAKRRGRVSDAEYGDPKFAVSTSRRA